MKKAIRRKTWRCLSTAWSSTIYALWANLSNTGSIPFSVTLEYPDWDQPSSWLGTDWQHSLVCWYSAGSVEHQGNKHTTFTLISQCRAILTQALCSIYKEQNNIIISVTCKSPTPSHTQTFLPQNLHTSQPTLHSVDVVILDFIFELLTQWGRSWFLLLLLVSAGNNCWHNLQFHQTSWLHNTNGIHKPESQKPCYLPLFNSWTKWPSHKCTYSKDWLLQKIKIYNWFPLR